MCSVNPHAQFVRSQHSDVPLEIIFNQRAFEADSVREAFGFETAAEAPSRPKSRSFSPMRTDADGKGVSLDVHAHHEGNLVQRAAPRAGAPLHTRRVAAGGGGGMGSGSGKGARRGSDKQGSKLLMTKVEHSPLVAAISMRCACRTRHESWLHV